MTRPPSTTITILFRLFIYLSIYFQSFDFSFDYIKVYLALFLSVYLTNRFHVAVRLFSNRSQMTSKNKLLQLSFSITRKPAFGPFGEHEKKAIWRNLLSIQNEAISLVAMRSKELWLVKKNHATVKRDSKGFSWNENLQRRQNWTAKSTNLKENTGKSTQFSSSEQPCEP